MRIFVLPSFQTTFLELLRFALSLTLSHGERGQIAESLILVGFSTIIPSPCGRGLGRGQNLKIHRIVFSAGKASGK